MKILLVAVGLLLGSAGTVLGQADRTYPFRTVSYLGANGSTLPGPDGAASRVERTFRDSLSGTVREYNAAGQIRKITPYAVMDQVKLGPATTYYETGQTHTKEDFVGAKRNGEFVVYYTDGKVKRRETYVDDVRQTGMCYAPDGSVVPFYEYEIMPRFKGATMLGGSGTQKVRAALASNVRYPASALMSQAQGKVYVAFLVTSTGQVTDVRVLKGVNEALDAAAVTAVKKLSGFTPGQLDGNPVAASFTIPVEFKITEAAPEPSPLRHRGGQYPVGSPSFRN
ncbi:energy transducer TonB [Hymenobacter elongatus]|uniref:TonB family protein n=1 Tax=Hymenobacter elongatus TaxID=877208 RepID=A0A4Z0PI20_9BACT|nr:energy transducer TonB [Hymenobacter elongatus]TGE13941.1 TonB family protein [Hymenobacter elongatus]